MKSTYKIPSSNLDDLLECIKHLNIRAKRNGLSLISVKELGTEIVAREDETKAPYVAHILEIEGESPIVNGWQLVAVLEHLDDATIVRGLPGLIAEGELSGYRNATRKCEHCNKDRLRNDTYILKSATEGYKQVGKTCLKDFTGYNSIEYLASIASELLQAIETATSVSDDEDMQEGGRSRKYLPLVAFLGWVAASIRTYGFVSRKSADEAGYTGNTIVPTAMDAISNMYPSMGATRAYNPTEEDQAVVTAALKWLPEQDASSDYMYTLQVICKQNAIEYRHTGYAASLISAYHKATAEQIEKAAGKQPAHVGVVGEKVTIVKAFCKKMFASRSLYERNAMTYMYVMVDGDGNEYKCNSSKAIMVECITYDLAAKVKAHDRFNGKAQTIVTHVKVMKEYNEAA